MVERVHLRSRANELAEKGVGGDPDILLDLKRLADWLAVSPRTLEHWRARKIGPKWHRLSAIAVRYRRADVLSWLQERASA